MKKLFFRRKCLTLALILFTVLLTKAQNQIPDFLIGTWKMETKEVYEHWDILDTQLMKGFTFYYEKGDIKVMEYLEIRKENGEIVYAASVLGQNEGKEITLIPEAPHFPHDGYVETYQPVALGSLYTSRIEG